MNLDTLSFNGSCRPDLSLAITQVEETVAVVVSRAPSNVHIEIDDAPTSKLVVNFREKKDQQVTTMLLFISSLFTLLVLSQMHGGSGPPLCSNCPAI